MEDGRHTCSAVGLLGLSSWLLSESSLSLPPVLASMMGRHLCSAAQAWGLGVLVANHKGISSRTRPLIENSSRSPGHLFDRKRQARVDKVRGSCHVCSGTPQYSVNYPTPSGLIRSFASCIITPRGLERVAVLFVCVLLCGIRVHRRVYH